MTIMRSAFEKASQPKTAEIVKREAEAIKALNLIFKTIEPSPAEEEKKNG